MAYTGSNKLGELIKDYIDNKSNTNNNTNTTTNNTSNDKNITATTSPSPMLPNGDDENDKNDKNNKDNRDDKNEKDGSNNTGSNNKNKEVRTEPKNLKEKLAMEEAKTNLEKAEDITNKMNIGDPKYKNGWSKMQYIHNNPDGSKTVIHYWKNNITGTTEGFKFK